MILPDSAADLAAARALLGRIAVVLVGTSHPGNIGASARAMKAMGLTDLRLVAPVEFPAPAATARAVGAHDLLDQARVYPDLGAALADCSFAWGTTARGRHLGWPTLAPREAAGVIAADSGRVALVFGRERTGLSNEELDLCQGAITIPTVADFSSLNLAQAVQIVAYEVGLVARAALPGAPRRGRPRSGEAVASADELAALRAHWLALMVDIDYVDPARPKLIERRLLRLVARARLLHSEAQILRGFLTAVEEALGRPPRRRD